MEALQASRPHLVMLATWKVQTGAIVRAQGKRS